MQIASNSFLRLQRAAIPVTIIIALALLAGCTFGTRLQTDAALPAEASGTYRLYLYGCRYPTDVEIMALLVDQTAPYRFDLFVPDDSYRIKEDLPGKAALTEADKFIRCSHHTLWTTAFRRIVDPAGRIIAFELKPLYFPHDVGVAEVLLTDYSLRNGTVRTYIRLDPVYERKERAFSNKPDASGR
jgi:hypothetical protein